METINHKISGVTPVRILGAEKTVGESPTMTIANINNTEVTVDVFYVKENYAVDGGGNAANTTSSFYIIKGFSLPNNKTLTLDKTDMSFNNKGFDLYLTLGAAGNNVDVIITI